MMRSSSNNERLNPTVTTGMTKAAMHCYVATCYNHANNVESAFCFFHERMIPDDERDIYPIELTTDTKALDRSVRRIFETMGRCYVCQNVRKIAGNDGMCGDCREAKRQVITR